MTRRTATATGALVLLAAALGTQGCREKLFSSAASKPSPDEACVDPSGSWIVVSPSQAFGPRVLILDIVADTVLRLAETPDSPAATAPHVRGVTAQPFQGITVSITERPSRAADGSWGTGLVPTTMSGTRGCSSLDFQGSTVLSGELAAFHLDLAADTVRGSVATGAGSTELFGLRVAPAQLVTTDSVGGATPVPDSTPVLMLRVDDVWAQDSLFLPKLLARGLTAELAVPTTYPGLPGRSPWADVIAEAQEGFGVAAHSRIHSEVTGPGFDFIVEVLGSMQDLKSRGLPTSVFVQPGPWLDSLYFDSEGKLTNWRGAFLRNVSQVFEAYEGGWAVPTGVWGSVPVGVTHTTISGYDSTSILYQFQHLFVRGSFTIFMFHSKDVNPPDQLDWLLDSIATAVAGGRLRLVNIATSLGRTAPDPQGSAGARAPLAPRRRLSATGRMFE